VIGFIQGDDTVHEFLNIKLIAMISLIGIGYFVVIIIAMHKLRPDYNFRSRYISEYAVGKYGQLAASSFVIYGLSILGIYLCLQTIMPVNARSNIGLILMAIWGVAKVIAGFFNSDLKTEQMSRHGIVHSITANIGVVASVICTIFLSIGFALNERTQSIALVTLIIGLVALILVVLLFLGLIGDMGLKYHHNVSGIFLSLHKLTGLTERLLLGVSVIWLAILVNFITH